METAPIAQGPVDVDVGRAAPETDGRHLNVPERVLQLLAEITPTDEHDDNGPGLVVCPACGGYTWMRWDSGRRLDNQSDVVHDSDCPAEWARKILTPNAD